MTAVMYIGDSIEVMSKLPEKSVDLILSSPPFLALRSYLPQDHPDKALEGGSQATPGEYIDWLLDVVEACARVLAPHGSLVFELADTYSGSGGAGGDYAEGGLRDGQSMFKQVGNREHRPEGHPKRGTLVAASRTESVPINGGRGWPLAKSLSLIPETFRFAMVYGINPHTGRRTEPWRLRNVVRWVRPNPPVGALGDKFRPATSELMVFCKAKDRYFDLDAVREPLKAPEAAAVPRAGTKLDHDGGNRGTLGAYDASMSAGAPPLDWWNIPLLEGEEPTRYGPKPKPESRPAQGDRKQMEARQKGIVRGAMAERTFHKDGGAPPLDWWNIPLLEGEEPTRYGPKEAKPIKEGIFNGPKAQTPSEDHGRGTYGFTERTTNPAGSPPLDWWNIPPGGYPGAHYAVWPPELLVKPIKAMCPEQVCRTCGEPRRPIREHLGRERYRQAPTPEEFAVAMQQALVAGGISIEAVAVHLDVTTELIHQYRGRLPGPRLPSLARWRQLTEILQFPQDLVEAMEVVDREYDTPDRGNRNVKERLSGGALDGDLPKVVQTGFSDCGHDNYRPGLVLDPFGGSGTTAAVATGHGRDCILIDLDERNYDLALDRVGPLILELGGQG